MVTQPMRGAEKEGAAGLLKGIGKGIGGLILKPNAGEYFQDATNLTKLLTRSGSYLGTARLRLHGCP